MYKNSIFNDDLTVFVTVKCNKLIHKEYTQMLSDEKKIELCEAILKSKTFQKSPKSSALLRYLVKTSINGDIVKEDIIDLEFFGDRPTTDKNSTRVRVNVYNLRKKLNDYYKTEGQLLHWLIKIDKGQYNVRFEKRKAKERITSFITIKNSIPYLFTALICSFFILKNLPNKPPRIWEGFFLEEKQNTLFIGDAYGIKGKTITGKEGWTRDYSIKNIDDYYKLLEKKPELKDITKPSDYNYITGMGAESSHDLMRLFAEFNSDFTIRYSSSSSFMDVKKGNLIYVGPFKNENKFISIFNEENPYFKLNGKDIVFSNHKNIPNKTISYSDFKNDRDIAVVSRIPSGQNNESFIFFSNHDMGVKATINYFTNKDSVKAFDKKYLKGKQYFTSIFYAYGKNRTNLKLETLMVVPF
ncbi:helix-turn-helix domain-containing protein [uncultured Maribacter sp.]|uniref:winged helix-turn-helix domain-containing protein n=1 Tax=uncultured Maribacter sp. TaxID=431308 RepID=UPI002608FAE4|nr:helix-turn-helix domain-containing protein [uncultured Maribacter sp.]